MKEKNHYYLRDTKFEKILIPARFQMKQEMA